MFAILIFGSMSFIQQHFCVLTISRAVLGIMEFTGGYKIVSLPLRLLKGHDVVPQKENGPQSQTPWVKPLFRFMLAASFAHLLNLSET